MTGGPGVVFVYEVRGRCGWQVLATSSDVREVAQLACQGAAGGLTEGRDFRTRAKFPNQPDGGR